MASEVVGVEDTDRGTIQDKDTLVSLHPIKALDHVIDEYPDYLRTEFRAKDPKLRAALEAELDARGFLAQEPFYQAHRLLFGVRLAAIYS